MVDMYNVAEYIKQTAGDKPEYIAPVSGGLSDVVKCRAEVCGQTFMVKILPGNPTRDLWYTELNKRSNDQMANPKMHRLFPDGNLCLLSPWIAGESLHDCLQSAAPELIDEYASQAAELLLKLHQTPVNYPAYQENLRRRIKGLCERVNDYELSFPGKEAVCNYLMKAAAGHTVNHVCFVHKDIRPENFIVKDGELYLIDFDNGSLGEQAADFPYLTTMVWPEHYAFAKKLIETYLSEVDESDFWDANLLYSTLQVVDYAVWKWETKKRQVFIQANNLLKQYDGLTKSVPAWWNELENE